MKTLKYYFAKAKKEKFAIGQFNFSDWSQVKGIIAAVAMVKILRRKTGLPIFLNLDHAKSFEYIKEAILAGYDMVHFDGSKLPLEENIKISKKVAALAKKHGVVVEGEVGRFGTDASRLYKEKFEIKEEDLTNLAEALNYLGKTRVDILAVSVGTFHGIDISGISPHIRLNRLKEIRQMEKNNKINIPLALHGGSGTPEEDIKEAIKLGIVKININTEIRLAFTNNLRKTLDTNKSEITPYKYFTEAIGVVKSIVEGKIKLFGSHGKV